MATATVWAGRLATGLETAPHWRAVAPLATAALTAQICASTPSINLSPFTLSNTQATPAMLVGRSFLHFDRRHWRQQALNRGSNPAPIRSSSRKIPCRPRLWDLLGDGDSRRRLILPPTPF